MEAYILPDLLQHFFQPCEDCDNTIPPLLLENPAFWLLSVNMHNA